MRVWNKRYVNISIEALEKQDVPLVLVGAANLDRTYKGRDIPTLKIYPITLVNLLGFYGDFEKDSNGDGLADGWGTIYISSNETTLESGIINSYAQQIYRTASASYKEAFLVKDNLPGFTSQHTYFISNYTKILDFGSPNHTYLQLIENAWEYFYSFNIYYASEGLNKWVRKYSKITLQSTNLTSTSFRLVGRASDVNLEGKFQFDGVAIYDLSNLGALPDPMKQIYGVDNWSDLTADQLAELLPFVNGVKTLGYEIWEDI